MEVYCIWKTLCFIVCDINSTRNNHYTIVNQYSVICLYQHFIIPTLFILFVLSCKPTCGNQPHFINRPRKFESIGVDINKFHCTGHFAHAVIILTSCNCNTLLEVSSRTDKTPYPTISLY